MSRQREYVKPIHTCRCCTHRRFQQVVHQNGTKRDKDVESANWVENLEVDKKGNFRQTTDNIVQILSNDPKLKDGIGGVDQFAQKPVKFGDLPWEKFHPSDTTWTDTELYAPPISAGRTPIIGCLLYFFTFYLVFYQYPR